MKCAICQRESTNLRRDLFCHHLLHCPACVIFLRFADALLKTIPGLRHPFTEHADK